MKTTLHLYLLPFVLLSFFVFGYSVTEQNPDYNTNGQQIRLTESSSIDNPFTTASWTTLTPSPHAQSRSFVTAVTISGVDYIYQFGGGATAALQNVARYNIQSASWQNNYSTMPFAVSTGTAVTMNDSLIYVLGGNSPVLGKCMKYNYISNTWQTMADMPTPVTDAAVMKYRDSLIYIVGGGTGLFGAGYFSTTQIYNINTNTYVTGTSYPLAVGMQGFGIYGDTMIIAGGWDGVAAVANAYKGIINPATHTTITWTPIPNYPAGATTRMASYFVMKGNGGGIVFAGGAVGGSTLQNTSYLFNMCTGAWQNLPPISQARSNFKGSGFGDSIAYVCGGFTTVGVGTFERVTFSAIDGACFLVGISNVNEITADKYSLSQNYPNPFNPSTKINFSVPVTNLVKLKVYDITGKEVVTLLNEVKSAGIYTVEFRGESLSSGTYFVRMESGDFSEIKSMVLIK